MEHVINQVHTGCGIYPASYPVGDKVSFTGGEEAGCEGKNLSASSADIKIRKLYIHSPIRLYCAVLN